MSRISSAPLTAAAVLIGAVVVTAQSGAIQTPAPQPTPSHPVRLAEMQHHFLQVSLVHEALIRGDLNAIREPARELSVLPIPLRVPASASPYVNLIRDAGRRLIAAPSLDAAAPHVSAMLAICGDCHRAVGVRPTPSSPSRPDVGGLVGHMLEHQRAMDELLQGLVIPSMSQWIEGARRLRTAPLHPAELLPDRGLTSEIRKAETNVHDLADRAIRASTDEDRSAVYGNLLADCSQCHGLHRAVWGPRRER